MNQNIFRKASMEKISSPEQLNEYIRISRPDVWIALVAAFVLLAAIFVWSAVGSLPVSISAAGIAGGGSLVCYLSPEEAAPALGRPVKTIYTQLARGRRLLRAALERRDPT